MPLTGASSLCQALPARLLPLDAQRDGDKHQSGSELNARHRHQRKANQATDKVNARTARPEERGRRVLGFFAHAGPGEVFRFEEACVIAGSRERLRACLAIHPNLQNASLTLAKIRFADVHAGLDAGAAYAFDEEAFERFAPLARDAGIDVAETFPAGEPDTFSFVKVALADADTP